MFDAETQCPNADRPAQWEDPTASGLSEPSSQGKYRPSPRVHRAPPLIPVTRGPYDCWHSEEYLIGWLVKGFGWRVLEPGVIARGNLAQGGR